MRPTKRPDQPYTMTGILDRIEQHFVTEGNPKCVDNNNNCIYGRTGCAVGCLLTQEDANLIDDKLWGCNSEIFDVRKNLPDIYNIYFRVADLHSLKRLQHTHDYHFADLASVITEMRREISNESVSIAH
jgi:hypothetical protein